MARWTRSNQDIALGVTEAYERRMNGEREPRTMTQTRYFYHSPRGFSNEADVYAVPAEIAEQWLETFEARLGSSADYAATAVESITRKAAERLIRRDGVGLQIQEEDYDWEDCTTGKLTPASLRSARRAAAAMIAEIKREMDFEADMDAAYPEFAVTPR